MVGQSNTMKAIEISKPGGPNVLRATERLIPVPNNDELLIKVVAAGINRPDLLQRAGVYPPPANASDLPGLEVSGYVTKSGKNSRYKEGDAVCALTNGGGYAEYCVAPIKQTLPAPSGITLTAAACIPETFFTVWSNLFQRGSLVAGERLLVHGGSSGIGTTAIQLAKQLGVRVFATAGSEIKCKVCEELGAELAINYKEKDFVEELMSVTKNEGVDIVLDMVGGSYIEKNFKVLRNEGKLIQIAFLESPKVNINMLPIMLKRLTVTGSTLRPQSSAAKGHIAEELESDVWPLIEGGNIAPIIDTEYKLLDAIDAHTYMETNRHIGKLVLVV